MRRHQSQHLHRHTPRTPLLAALGSRDAVAAPLRSWRHAHGLAGFELCNRLCNARISHVGRSFYRDEEHVRLCGGGGDRAGAVYADLDGKHEQDLDGESQSRCCGRCESRYARSGEEMGPVQLCAWVDAVEFCCRRSVGELGLICIASSEFLSSRKRIYRVCQMKVVHLLNVSNESSAFAESVTRR